MKYQVLYFDPPWKYRNKKTGGSMKSGAEQQYPTMTVDEICALDIKDIAEKDSILFLWVTTPMMQEGMQVMKAFGYKYKTKIYWRKIMSLGMGFWFRGQVEELWLGIRGNIKAFRLQEKNIIEAKVLKHSQKPIEFRQLIERATKNYPNKLEIFAREKHDGWDSIGFDIDGMDIKDSINQIKNL